MKNLLEEIFRLKKEGLNNTQIAKKLNIRRQDLVVIFKYLRDVNPQFFEKLEELEELRKEYLRLKEEAQQEREKAKNEVEHEMFILNAKVSKYEQDLKEKEEKIKELEEEIQKINERLAKCVSRKEELKEKYFRDINKLDKQLNDAKIALMREKNEIVAQKNEMIKELEDKLNNCKPIKCYLSRFFNILFILGLLGVVGAGGYFAYKYRVFDVKKKVYEEDWKDYKQICYVLGIFKTKYVSDYKYQFCYYKKKETKDKK